MSTPQGSQPLPDGYELKKKKKPWYQRLGCIIPLALVAIIVIAIAVSGGEDDNTGTTTDDTATTAPAEQDAPAEEGAPAEEDDDVPSEYRTALRSAERYLQSGNFSQEGLYGQLTSQFDQYSPEAARYAVENVDADWNEEALGAARSYQDTMDMSPAAIYDQLTSQFEQYTPEQAQYAVDNL